MLEWLPLAYALHCYVRENRLNREARAVQPMQPAPSYTYAPTTIQVVVLPPGLHANPAHRWSR